jgi:high-affinity Fe2+/Pb2+ permease
MRILLRGVRTQPEKLESGVRKWLTYIALLLASATVIGDLVTFLSYFLRGDLTTRFVLKVLTVLVIAGGVFWYYLLWLERPSERPSD